MVREPKFIWKYYRPFALGQNASKARYIFMADGRRGHGGMFDRLKGLISVYAVAKSYGAEFRINFCYPFDLRKYLVPNEYDWTVDGKDINYNYPKAKPVIAYGEINNPSRLWGKFGSGERHFYYGYNSLDDINAHFGTKYDWGALYHELFKPSEYLQAHLDAIMETINCQNYIAIHTRFLNLLGDKNETGINPELPKDEKERLKEKCCAKIKELNDEYLRDNPNGLVLLASDSMTFINYMKSKLPNVFIVPGTVKHIDTAGNTSDDENLKMFADYHMIAGADKVYNLVAEGMWKSAFAEYPAKIGGKPFERIFI